VNKSPISQDPIEIDIDSPKNGNNGHKRKFHDVSSSSSSSSNSPLRKDSFDTTDNGFPSENHITYDRQHESTSSDSLIQKDNKTSELNQRDKDVTPEDFAIDLLDPGDLSIEQQNLEQRCSHGMGIKPCCISHFKRISPEAWNFLLQDRPSDVKQTLTYKDLCAICAEDVLKAKDHSKVESKKFVDVLEELKRGKSENDDDNDMFATKSWLTAFKALARAQISGKKLTESKREELLLKLGNNDPTTDLICEHGGLSLHRYIQRERISKTAWDKNQFII